MVVNFRVHAIKKKKKKREKEEMATGCGSIGPDIGSESANIISLHDPYMRRKIPYSPFPWFEEKLFAVGAFLKKANEV